MGKNVVIIGGGIVGLCSAYYLHKKGHQITVVEKSNFSSGASYVNAGYVTPSHFISLASPEMLSKGLKWMFNPNSPLYIKPRMELDFLKWAWAFKKSATSLKVEQSIKPLLDINLLSRELYEDFKASSDFNFHYERKGLLMCYKTDKVGEEEWNIGKRGIKEGLTVEHLSPTEVTALEPEACLNIKGAVYYHSDAHMTPQDFMQKMLSYLKHNGVLIYSSEEVIDLKITKHTISKIITNKQLLDCDEIVLAAGSWSSPISKKLDLKLLMQAGKGYSINVMQDTKITIPAILCEAKVAVTPMDGFTRFSGTMEISGINNNLNKLRVEAIAKASASYYQNLDITLEEKANAKSGLRPCSPDGLPYIGKSFKYKNLTIATGHAMMGWSLGPATGKLISEIISGEKTTVNLALFHPDRKF